mmetsp:Transcript_11967/g.27347  ORF Transcript_11967/g.27347 Transcript_11967/m.27347 type:complete len:236 (-) Transcript_11967:536-1243(-)
MNSFAPRRITVAALLAEQPLMKMKSLSPSRSSQTSSAEPRCAGSKASSPSMVAMVRITCPPVHLAMRRMSFLSTRRTAMMPASIRYFMAKSSMPLVVNRALVPAPTIFWIFSLVMSISRWRTFSSSAGSSMTMFTPMDILCFLRSKSSSAILACLTDVTISCEARMVCKAYPFGRRVDSVLDCPCDLRTLIWFTGCLLLPSTPVTRTALTASTTSFPKRSLSAPTNFEESDVFAI